MIRTEIAPTGTASTSAARKMIARIVCDWRRGCWEFVSAFAISLLYKAKRTTTPILHRLRPSTRRLIMRRNLQLLENNL